MIGALDVVVPAAAVKLYQLGHNAIPNLGLKHRMNHWQLRGDELICCYRLTSVSLVSQANGNTGNTANGGRD